MKRRLLTNLIEIIALVAWHAWMLHYLAATNTMAVLFSAGNHAPVSTLATAGGFLLLRLWVILILPGAVLYRLTMLLTRNR